MPRLDIAMGPTGGNCKPNPGGMYAVCCMLRVSTLANVNDDADTFPAALWVWLPALGVWLSDEDTDKGTVDCETRLSEAKGWHEHSIGNPKKYHGDGRFVDCFGEASPLQTTSLSQASFKTFEREQSGS